MMGWVVLWVREVGGSVVVAGGWWGGGGGVGLR